jgi:hypothetical protein
MLECFVHLRMVFSALAVCFLAYPLGSAAKKSFVLKMKYPPEKTLATLRKQLEEILTMKERMWVTFIEGKSKIPLHGA